jgi:Undecaprenyl-phosphate glucose phosphotransferase
MRTRNLISLLLLLDLCIMNFSIIAISTAAFGWNSTYHSFPHNLFALFNVSWVLTSLIFVEDAGSMKFDFQNILHLHLKKFAVFIAIICICMISLKIFDFSRTVFFGATIIFFLVKIGVIKWLYYTSFINNKACPRPTVIIGRNPIGEELYRYFSKYSHLGLKPIGILCEKTKMPASTNTIGKLADYQQICDSINFHDVIIALPLGKMKAIKELIAISEKNGIRPHVIPNYYGFINKAFKVETIGNVPFLNIRNVPLDRYSNRFWKRFFDIVFASTMLLLLFPVFIIIAIAIKIDSKGPVLYKPIRLGVGGRPFVVYKFRSMKVSDDAVTNATKSTVLNDPRITKLGQFLRKYNLDELPQLINVLNNEMSIVGPRPHREHLNTLLKQKASRYMVRHLIKPGITGWAQVNGWRGPTETRLQYMGRTLHDIWYIENWSIWLDAYIVFLTVFSRKTYKNAF